MRARLAISLLGALTCVAGVAAEPAAGAASPPRPVSQVYVSTYTEHVIVHWTKSPDTPEAVVCYDEGQVAPSQPAPPATCSPSESGQPEFDFADYGFIAERDTDYAISVFSYDSASQTYGPPVSTSANVGHPAPSPARGAVTSARSSRSVRLIWGDADCNCDGQPWLETVEWVVTVVPGTSPPPHDAQPTAIVPNEEGGTSVVSGLKPGRPYTAAIRGRNAEGETSRRGVITFSARSPGLRVTTSADGGWRPYLAPGSAGADAGAAVDVAADGHTRAVYAVRGQVLYSSRTRTRDWSPPVVVGGARKPGFDNVQGPFIARSPGGRLVAAWTDGGQGYYAVRPAGSLDWGKPHQVRLPNTQIGAVRGLAVDAQGRIHLLVLEAYGPLVYLVHDRGGWSRDVVPAGKNSNIVTAALAFDPVTERIVVVDLHVVFSVSSPPVEVRIATAAAAEHLLGPWRVLHRVPDAINARVAPSVTSYGGMLTVGLSLNAYRDPKHTGVFTMRGLGADHVGHFHRVAGTDTHATELVVHADAAARVELMWAERGRTWTRRTQGVFRVARVHREAGWQYGRTVHVSTSRYAVPVTAVRDRGGHLHTAVTTIKTSGGHHRGIERADF